MKKDKELLRKVRQGVCSVALLSACMVNMTSCNEYDLDERDPEGWGANIYSFLQDKGNYTNVTRLINDLGLTEKLQKTTSSTLFASNDEAYNRFYQNNEWGVRSYEQLSLAQKKMLLRGSMISNPYQVNDLSSVENRDEGMCMRRTTSQTFLDSVPVYKPSELPNMKAEDWAHNKFWKRFQDKQNVVLFQDATITPMLHFIENFMVNNKITNDDYDFIFNIKDAAQKRQPGDASVNGVKIVTQNNRCSNGFVHEMGEVIMPLANMAETIKKDKELTIYNRLLERFAFPHYLGKEITDQYNYNYGTSVDSVFEKRFFSEKSQNGRALYTDDFGKSFSETNDVLVFDPEWNTYYSGDVKTTEDERMKNDMAVMLVPSDKAMNDFWNASNGPGYVLRKQYPGGLNTVPNKVIVKLLNNNMLTEFTKSVPSKFNNILNSNNDPMGITKNDIERVILANNGAIYVTNKVFAPTEYVSVLYPSSVNETMSIMDWAIKENEYNVYLNSLQATYALIIHTNECLDYIDPLSVLLNKPEEWKLWRFHYDATRAECPVYADIHTYNSLTGEIIIDPQNDKREEWSGTLAKRLRDILDASIIVNEKLDNSKKYYRTMGYQTIRIDNPSAEAGGMTVMGSRQINEEEGSKPLYVTEVYNQTKESNGEGNGMCYIIGPKNGQQQSPIMGTFKSALEMMEETVNDATHNPTGEMSMFLNLIKDRADLFVEEVRDGKYFAFTPSIKSFNTFHYTIYVPTNASIKEWLKKNDLVDPNNPDVMGWDYIETLPQDNPTQKEKHDKDSLKLMNFVKFHFQDNALYIGAKAEKGDFSTSYIQGDKFMKVTANLDGNNISVQDYDKAGPARHVVKTPGLYNIMAREYFFSEPSGDPKTAKREDCNDLYGASSIVIHLIDGPLVYKDWKY